MCNTGIYEGLIVDDEGEAVDRNYWYIILINNKNNLQPEGVADLNDDVSYGKLATESEAKNIEQR